MYKIDLKNRKILYELDRNCRQSLNQIGRKVNLSKNAVRYRIALMKKIGLIKRFHTIINIGKLGYIGFRIYLNLQNTTPNKEKEIISYLKAKPNVTWIASMDGMYNLGIFVVAKNISEVHDLWDELMEQFINYFDERSLTIITNSSYFSIGYLVDLERSDHEIITTTPQDQTIDDADKGIVGMLAENGDIPIIHIAKNLGYSSKTIIQRIKNLEKKNVIVAYKTFLDFEKLGYQHFKVNFILLKVTKQKEREFRQYAKYHPNIVYEEQYIGGDDIELGIHVKDIAQLRKILDDIKSRFSDIIHDYKTLQIYEEHKNTYFIADDGKKK
jgi:DNA-binding Lrp family transcriptional regulator